MNDSHNQIPLNFKTDNQFTFDDFIVENNAAVINSLKSFESSSEYLMYLWGEPGSGKSHLLNALVDQNNQSNIPSVLITPQDLSKRENVSLIEMFDCVCVDDLEKISGDTALEEALFFWINEVKQAKKKIILSSQNSNNDENWQLPDLRSRIASGRTHQLLGLSRDSVINVFVQQALQKGIVLDEKVIQYLQNNCPMNMGFLKQLLLHLDKITLIHKKQVTIPLIKKILQTVLVS